MSNVWLTIPSARPPEEAEPILRQWREHGYKIALWTDSSLPGFTPHYRIREIADVEMQDRPEKYPGYAVAVNTLIHYVMKRNTDADWFICTGDDTIPDPNKSAEEIARECTLYFVERLLSKVPPPTGATLDIDKLHAMPTDELVTCPGATFGVMQPTGDRWHEGEGGFESADIDRVCGSAWMGREFCRRIYGGKGPLWPEFQHMFVDEHLQCVAQKLGILWQRRDLTQKHLHWKRGLEMTGIERKPEHAEKWNTPEHWNEAKALFERLKAGGFQEAEDLL